jgi:hypothetical protein
MSLAEQEAIAQLAEAVAVIAESCWDCIGTRYSQELVQTCVVIRDAMRRLTGEVEGSI